MDVRINRSPLFNRLHGVGNSKRVDPAKQKDPRQDTPKFSDQLKMARKSDDEENQQHQEEQKNKQDTSENREQNQSHPSEEPPAPKPPDADAQDENEVGTNVDIKV